MRKRIEPPSNNYGVPGENALHLEEQIEEKVLALFAGGRHNRCAGTRAPCKAGDV